MVTAVISGANSWTEIKLFGDLHLDWLRKYRPFERGIPVDDTIARIIKRIDPKAFNDIFINFINEVGSLQGRELITVDGKTLRHSFNAETQTALHRITVWSKSQGLVLLQRKSDSWKNEQAGVLEVLDSLCLKNAVVSVDAMSTRKKIAEKIKACKGGYVMPLKHNHRVFRAELEAYFHKAERDTPDKIARYQETDSERGRIDERHYRQLAVDKAWLTEATKWAGIKTVVCVERRRIEQDRESRETAYYISSLTADVTELARSIRGHWEVENKAHWVLDVVYKEDECAVTDEWGAENLAVLRRLSLNLARLHPKKESMRSKLKRAGWSDSFRDELLLGGAIK